MHCNALPISWWVFGPWPYIFFRLIIDLFTYEDFDFWFEWSFVFQYSIISAQARNWWIFCCMLCYGIIYGCAASTSINTITYFKIIFFDLMQMLGKEGKTEFDITHYLSTGGKIRNKYHIHCNYWQAALRIFTNQNCPTFMIFVHKPPNIMSTYNVKTSI